MFGMAGMLVAVHDARSRSEAEEKARAIGVLPSRVVQLILPPPQRSPAPVTAEMIAGGVCRGLFYFAGMLIAVAITLGVIILLVGSLG